MSAFDRLDDSFPHGTVDGYRRGCRGSVCPAPLPCRDVYTRAAGDFGFARKLAAGVPLAVILEEEQAAARAAAEAERAALRAARPKKPRLSGGDGASSTTREGVARLHAEGKTDREIAAELGLAYRYVARVRVMLKLTANAPKVVAGAERVGRLHAEGKTDAEIAAELGISRHTVLWHRRKLGVRANGTAGPRGGRPKGPIWDVLPRLHAEGLSDVEIAERTGAKRSLVCQVRGKLGLAPNVKPRRRRQGATA